MDILAKTILYLLDIVGIMFLLYLTLRGNAAGSPDGLPENVSKGKLRCRFWQKIKGTYA
jgi:hypothetical protein